MEHQGLNKHLRTLCLILELCKLLLNIVIAKGEDNLWEDKDRGGCEDTEVCGLRNCDLNLSSGKQEESWCLSRSNILLS